jgi:glutathione synthase/RimK-type ligase-like ATP-grasp enzyme
MSFKIVIFSNSHDEHTHSVINQINKFRGSVYRIDVDRLSTHFTFHFSIGNSSFYCETPVGTFSSKDIASVWIRRPYVHFSGTPTPYSKLAEQEIHETIKTIADFFPTSTKIVDKPSNVYVASRKLHVLKKARSFGLTIPKTIVTTSLEEAHNFIQELKGDVIVKAINAPAASYNKKEISIPTAKVDMSKDLASIKNCPTLFQQNIHKQKEFRITVIGNKIFPVSFSTQHIKEARIDSRMSYDKLRQIPHTLDKLPYDVERKIRELVTSLGLNFSAIDMALTPEGEYVFFELNPAGQFLWLEPLTGIPLAKEMAQYLLEKK